MTATEKERTGLFDKVDWYDVLDTLADQKCVLFLGSGAFEAPGGGNIEKALTEHLDAANPDHPHIRIFNPDGFYLFKKRRFKRKVIEEMRQFFNRPFPETEALFGKLARLPFSMLITLTPDNILSRTFDMNGFENETDFYFRNRIAHDKFEKPTKDKPLIYNLLGNIEEPESLVLTHADFYDYLKSIFAAKSMPQDMKDELEKMDRYIFLGLPYEKWYFQLLLRVLSLHSPKLEEIERLAMKEFEDPRLFRIYTEEFKIDFFPASSKSFIEELYRQCEQKGMLKPLPAPDPEEEKIGTTSPDKMKELIEEAKTKEAMVHLKVFLKNHRPHTSEMLNDLVVLRNRFNLLSQREMRGSIRFEDFKVENQIIVEGLLELITKAENL